MTRHHLPVPPAHFTRRLVRHSDTTASLDLGNGETIHFRRDDIGATYVRHLAREIRCETNAEAWAHAWSFAHWAAWIPDATERAA